ncbi:MAG: OB-fold domain-containing protein [Phycisphaerales bacterium]|nr:OB-fold domain-containing protein [Phycisphaerales bacterium]
MTIELDGTSAEILSKDPMVVKNLKTWFHSHTYGGWSKFFQGLQEKKLWATRCTNPECGENRLFIPPRCDCVDCWHRTEWVQAPTVGKVYTFSTITYPGELFRASHPCPLISIEIEGVCTKLMSYMREGKPEFGMPVKAVFNTENPTNTILDLSWVPA